MDDKKCAHHGCHCVSTPTSEVCGDSCGGVVSDMSSDCACGHEICLSEKDRIRTRRAEMEAKTLPKNPEQPRGEDPGHSLIDPK